MTNQQPAILIPPPALYIVIKRGSNPPIYPDSVIVAWPTNFIGHLEWSADLKTWGQIPNQTVIREGLYYSQLEATNPAAFFRFIGEDLTIQQTSQDGLSRVFPLGVTQDKVKDQTPSNDRITPSGNH